MEAWRIGVLGPWLVMAGCSVDSWRYDQCETAATCASDEVCYRGFCVVDEVAAADPPSEDAARPYYDAARPYYDAAWSSPPVADQVPTPPVVGPAGPPGPKKEDKKGKPGGPGGPPGPKRPE